MHASLGEQQNTSQVVPVNDPQSIGDTDTPAKESILIINLEITTLWDSIVTQLIHNTVFFLAVKQRDVCLSHVLGEFYTLWPNN